jgi:hypothetical protein
VREGFDGTVNEAAVQFSVSEEAMGWRLYNLKVIDRKPTMKVVEERPN